MLRHVVFSSSIYTLYNIENTFKYVNINKKLQIDPTPSLLLTTGVYSKLYLGLHYSAYYNVLVCVCESFVIKV